MPCQASAPRWPPPGGRGPRPTAARLAWRRHEFALFLHFGANAFTNRERGGREWPAIVAPAARDARVMGARGPARRRPVGDPHRQAPRWLLPVADVLDDALGGVEPVPRRRGGLVREFVEGQRMMVRCRASARRVSRRWR